MENGFTAFITFHGDEIGVISRCDILFGIGVVIALIKNVHELVLLFSG
jgi:hypothetical protein